MERFSLILQSLPEAPEQELLAELRELGWKEGELPFVLQLAISDSEAKILKGELEFLGAEVELLPENVQTENSELEFGFADEYGSQKLPQDQNIEVPPVDEISFEDLSLELDRELEQLKASSTASVSASVDASDSSSDSSNELNLVDLIAAEEEKNAPWTFTLEETAEQGLVSSAPVLKPVPNSVNEKIKNSNDSNQPVPAFSLSLEDSDISPPVAAPVHVPQVSPTQPTLARPDEAVLDVPNEEKIVPNLKVGRVESAPSSIKSTATTSSKAVADDHEEDDEGGEWYEEDDEELDLKLSFLKKNKSLGALILTAVIAGIGYILINLGSPKTSTTNTGDMVGALLDEQEKIIREERKSLLAQMQQKIEHPQEIIAGHFNISDQQKVDPQKPTASGIIGEIKFGRYSSGLLLEEFSASEPSQERISPQDLAAGKIPRPWLKKLDATIVHTSNREPLGADYQLDSDALGYFEDSRGTLRVPLYIRLRCHFKSGAKLECGYDIKNKALAEKIISSAIQSFKVEREEHLGFLVLLSGNFHTELNPINTAPSVATNSEPASAQSSNSPGSSQDKEQ